MPQPPLCYPGIIQGIRNCWMTTKTPSNSDKIMLCQKVLANTRPSCPFNSVVDTPVEIFCGEIILPITPPEELVAAKSTGLNPKVCAAAAWRLPNRAFPEVSLPARKTATHPRNGDNRANK